MSNNSISSVGMERLLRPREADPPLHRHREYGRAVSIPSPTERTESGTWERLRDRENETTVERDGQ